MGKVPSKILQVVVVLVATAWAFALLQAQMTCSVVRWIGPHCTDGKGEIWMLPLFTAAFGIPALAGSVFILVRAMRRR
jgi:hypothetical protein